MELIIKKATWVDIPAIHEITQLAFKKYASDLGLPEQVSALKETEEMIYQDLQTKTILVAFLNEKPVGSIRYEILPGNIGYISRFGVRPDIHNNGIGKALILAVEEDAKKNGVTLLTLHTASKITSLVRFYYGMGFYIHSTTTDRGYIRALFCKELEQDNNMQLDV